MTTLFFHSKHEEKNQSLTWKEHFSYSPKNTNTDTREEAQNKKRHFYLGKFPQSWGKFRHLEQSIIVRVAGLIHTSLFTVFVFFLLFFLWKTIPSNDRFFFFLVFSVFVANPKSRPSQRKSFTFCVWLSRIKAIPHLLSLSQKLTLKTPIPPPNNS